jgi:hypothetical protein
MIVVSQIFTVFKKIEEQIVYAVFYQLLIFGVYGSKRKKNFSIKHIKLMKGLSFPSLYPFP